jgi:pimeloyl-ACP methyl ester carboxylesterase
MREVDLMLQKFKYLRYGALWTCLVILAACGGGGDTPPASTNPQRGEVVSVTPTVTYDVTTLQNLTSSTLFSGYVSSMAYPVQVYKVVYWTTDHTGALLQASGLLAIPQNSAGSTTALLSFDNGTVFNNNEAPSNSVYLTNLAAMIASTDFIVTMPDYIGYGESVAELHPYLHAESLANTTIDLLRAAKHYLADNSIGLNGQLFLAGYSEGGYACVATHKALQQQFASEFTVTADFAGAGPYDLRGTADTLLAGTTLPYAPYEAFFFKAYDEIYGWHRISDIFQAAYVDPVNNDFYGNYTGPQIDSALTNVTADLFTATFLSNYYALSGETEIKTRLQENNVYDWAPQAPIRLFHGMDDITVPYANATIAKLSMTSNGASDVQVVNCTATPANHANCSLPYLNDMLGYFLGF